MYNYRLGSAAFDPSPVTDTAGTGHLAIARSRGRSVVTRAYASSPLRFLTPRNHGTAAWVYASSYGGGLVGGDALRLTVDVGKDASVFLSSQASTKVYRSQQEAGMALAARIAPGAALVLWPEPVSCFADSSYVQRQDVDLAGGASLVLVDTMTSGRRGSGERWRFTRYRSTVSLRYDGRLALFDAVDLSPLDGDLATRMGRFDVVCTAIVAGEPLRRHADCIVETASSGEIVRRAPVLVAAARIGDIGCVLRVAGRSAEEVARALREYLSFVPSVLGDDPWARKW